MRETEVERERWIGRENKGEPDKEGKRLDNGSIKIDGERDGKNEKERVGRKEIDG